jgi:hypothetical protein
MLSKRFAPSDELEVSPLQCAIECSSLCARWSQWFLLNGSVSDLASSLAAFGVSDSLQASCRCEPQIDFFVAGD